MRKKYLNFLIIPEGSPKEIKFRLSFWKTWMLLGFLGFWSIALIVLTILYGRSVPDLISDNSLRQENERLKQYNAKVVELEKELQEYRMFTRKVAELAGIEYPIEAETKLALAEGTEPVEEVISEKSDYSFQAELSSLPENIENDSTVASPIGSELTEGSHPEVERNAEVESDSLRHVPRGKPIDGWITRGFSMNEYDFGGRHAGMDFAAKESTEVKVTADGTVNFVGWDDVFGNLVMVDHGNGYITCYGHNSKILVSSGDLVKRGEVIALSGNSGKSSAPHLHYEIRKVENPAAGGNGVPIDPKDFLNPK
jgi:murein DD-endopeptidase MepM/ murein hydrolase activator NlpD